MVTKTRGLQRQGGYKDVSPFQFVRMEMSLEVEKYMPPFLLFLFLLSLFTSSKSLIIILCVFFSVFGAFLWECYSATFRPGIFTTFFSGLMWINRFLNAIFFFPSFSEGHVRYMTLMYSMSPVITFLKTEGVTEQSRAAAVRQALWNREGSLQTRVLRL